MPVSHLYPGFRYAGSLPSVFEQRKLQAQMLAELQPKRMLVIGCGYGDELVTLLSGLRLDDGGLSVTAVDLADVGECLGGHDFARSLGARFEFAHLDVLQCGTLVTYGQFDVVQCGFVLHDIPYAKKDEVLALLSSAIVPGGYLILSDFFAGNHALNAELECVYNAFIDEGHQLIRTQALREEKWLLLAGDGEMPGLLRSRRDALVGLRDYIDEQGQFAKRLRAVGLQICEVLPNPVNHRLSVVVARRSEIGSNRGTER